MLAGSLAVRAEAINLDVGAIVSAAVKQETQNGIAAKPFFDAGDSIPNDILVPLVADR